MRKFISSLLIALTLVMALPLSAGAGYEGRANTAAVLNMAAYIASVRAASTVPAPYYQPYSNYVSPYNYYSGPYYGGQSPYYYNNIYTPYGYGRMPYLPNVQPPICNCATWNAVHNYGFGNLVPTDYSRNYVDYALSYPVNNYRYNYSTKNYSYKYSNAPQVTTQITAPIQSSITWSAAPATQSNIAWSDPVYTREQSSMNWNDYTADRVQSNINWSDQPAVQSQSNINW